jgi:VWFA-related protein
MGKNVRWLLIFCLAVPVFAADPSAPSRVSVERLEHLLSNANSKTDGDVARQISSLELTERLSAARYQQLKALLPGEKSRQALLALADSSMFLEPPASDVPATAAPDFAAQKRMLSLTLGYLGRTLPLLPDLFAVRDTQRFENRAVPADVAEENPLRPVDHSAVTVFYRQGQEFVDAGAAAHGKKHSPDKGLTTWGEFGPIMGIVVMDAARSHLAWSHWELGASGALAVFRYSVPKEKSHYDVRFCCVVQTNGFELSVLSQRAGYHGEIAIDPDNGTILRISLISDLDPGNPISHASILVEYGPEDIGGKTFICPVRGIAVAQGPDLKSLNDAMAQRQQMGIEKLQPSIEKASLQALVHAPEQTLLNDVVFRDYHLYTVQSRILSEKEAKQAVQAAASAPAPTPPPSIDNAVPLEEVASPKAPPPMQPGMESLASNAPPPPLGAPASSIPEIYVTPALSLPQTPTISLSSAPAGTPTFRINARIVDVPLVALDKKGHPIADINPDDLEVFDNGVKVDVRSFVRPNTGAAGESAAAQSSNQSEPEFSNRAAVSAKSTARETQDTLILLIDDTLSMSDLGNVREQVETFLKQLHENDRAAVYVMLRGGFKILQVPSTNHELIATTLAKWTPSADSLSLGQEMEARNRQQMDYVNNLDDMLDVNGNVLMDPESGNESPDPKLRELGDRPGSDALSTLMLVAHYLSAMSGHKNLVWIASDNVLADWNYSAMNMQKGEHNIEPAALRVQEAMNDAHVSVYPLDASRLEGGMISASEANINVQLSPTNPANQMGSCGLASGNGPRIQSGMGLAQGPVSDPALTSGPDIDTCSNDLRPGRMMAQAHQDMLSIQGVYREIADATGGQAFRRASDIVGELNHVADDGRATYLLSFAPTAAADNKYHVITIKLPNKKKITLRYRSGYFYREEPSTIKDRFKDAALQPADATDIGVTANVEPGSKGHTIKLGIAATDLEIAQNDSLWTDKVDVFLVERQVSGMKAQITGQTMNLRLQPGSYQKYLKDGIPFDQAVELAPGTGSVRIVVLDENSGRMGSVTIPVAALGKAS